MRDENNRKRVIQFLGQISKKAIEHKVARFISNLPVVVLRDVTKEKGCMVAQLEKLGAKASFIPSVSSRKAVI